MCGRPERPRLDEQVQAIRPSLLSRTRLEQLIKDYDLYEDERRSMVLEDVVELMRREIHVDLRPQTQSFVLRYTERTHKVRDVTNRLANNFIDESMKVRATLADNTDAFLDSRLDDAKRRLVDTEAHGRIPEGPCRRTAVPVRVQPPAGQERPSTGSGRGRQYQPAGGSPRATGADIADLESSPVTSAPVAAGTAPEAGAAIGGATQRLQAAMAELAALEAAGNRPTHPDAIAAKRRIGELQTEAEAGSEGYWPARWPDSESGAGSPPETTDGLSR